MSSTSTTPNVTLDFSKAQPVQADSSQQAVTLDFSKAQHVDGTAFSTDSMDADYQFKHPALTDEENKQLKAANLSRPLYRKILGLPANDPAAAALQEKDQAHQTESAQHSSYVQQQLTDKAVGGAIVAAAPVAAGTAYAASSAPVIGTVGPPAARVVGTAVRLARSPLAQEIIKKALGGAAASGFGTATYFAIKHLLGK